MTVAVALWCLFDLLIYLAEGLETKLVLLIPDYVAIASLPVLSLLFILTHIGNDAWLTRRTTVALFLLPLLMVTLCATNELHQLFFASATIVYDSTGPMLALARGPLYFLHPVYSYIMLISGLALLARHWRASRGPYRGQASTMLLGAIFPVAANIAYLTGLWPYTHIDPTPVSFVALLIAFALGVSRFGLLDLRPIARDAIIESLRDGVLVLDTERRVIDLNPSAMSLLNISVEAPLGKPVRALLADHPQILNAIDQDKSIQVRTPHRYVDLRQSRVFDKKGRIAGTALTMRDVTEKQQTEDALRYASFHDALTSLYNRAFLVDHLRRLQTGRERPISVVSLDIDGLKLVNDTLGHSAGDDLLQVAANLISISFRASDVVARMGGDEFAVILPQTDHEVAAQACRRLDLAIAKHNSSAAVPLSISWGVHASVSASDSLEDALRLADLDMYREKLERSGRYRLAFVDAILGKVAACDWGEGHLVRVRALSLELGNRLGLSPHSLARLGTLARTHDLGNVGLPPRILSKPDPLTPGELEEIRGHVTTGYRIARASPDLLDVADLILHHHEWWNGQGYPSGYQGGDIPIECRVLSVADAYDALTNDRPYREANTHDFAMWALKERAGTQFDPTVVQCFQQFADSRCWIAPPDMDERFPHGTLAASA